MKRILICVLVAMTLFGCEKSCNIDIIEFCKRFTAESQTLKLTEEMLMRDESSGVYLIFVGENDTSLLKVVCDDKNVVSAFTVTGPDKESVTVVAEKAVTASGKQGFDLYKSDGYYTAVCV